MKEKCIQAVRIAEYYVEMNPLIYVVGQFWCKMLVFGADDGIIGTVDNISQHLNLFDQTRSEFGP